MGRTTVTDVREKVEQLNNRSGATGVSFEHWSNKYQLTTEDESEDIGPTCEGASEFMKCLRMFENARRL